MGEQKASTMEWASPRGAKAKARSSGIEIEVCKRMHSRHRVTVPIAVVFSENRPIPLVVASAKETFAMEAKAMPVSGWSHAALGTHSHPRMRALNVYPTGNWSLTSGAVRVENAELSNSTGDGRLGRSGGACSAGPYKCRSLRAALEPLANARMALGRDTERGAKLQPARAGDIDEREAAE